MISRLAALGLALTTAGALTACAGQNGSQAGAPGGAAEGRALYDQLVTQIYGTANQRAAAEELAFLTAQHAIAACTAKVGVTYGIPTYVDVASEVVSPGDLLAFAPLRSDFGVGEQIQRLAAAGEGVNAGLAAASSDEERDRWGRALENCQGEMAYGNSLASPPGRDELDARFVPVLQAVQDRFVPDLSHEYGVCMHQAGIDARDLAETYLDVWAAYPAVSYAEPSDVTQLPRWAGAVAFEEKSAAADAACRADSVDIAMAAVRRDLTDFAATNESALSANTAAWEDLETRLIALRAQLGLTD